MAVAVAVAAVAMRYVCITAELAKRMAMPGPAIGIVRFNEPHTLPPMWEGGKELHCLSLEFLDEAGGILGLPKLSGRQYDPKTLPTIADMLEQTQDSCGGSFKNGGLFVKSNGVRLEASATAKPGEYLYVDTDAKKDLISDGYFMGSLDDRWVGGECLLGANGSIHVCWVNLIRITFVW